MKVANNHSRREKERQTARGGEIFWIRGRTKYGGLQDAKIVKKWNLISRTYDICIWNGPHGHGARPPVIRPSWFVWWLLVVRVISTKMLILWCCHCPNHRFYRTVTDERNALRGTVEQRTSKELVGGTKCCKNCTFKLGGGWKWVECVIVFVIVLSWLCPITLSVFLKKPKMKKKNRIERSCMYFVLLSTCMYVVVHTCTLPVPYLPLLFQKCQARPGKASHSHIVPIWTFEHTRFLLQVHVSHLCLVVQVYRYP
jgi:hypothetical protein